MNNSIQHSQELVAFVRRWHMAMKDKDSATLNNMLSHSDCLRYQGSAEGEEWAGPVFRNGFADHVHEIPDFDWAEHSVEAFSQGTVGWAHTVATLRFATTEKSMVHRFTHVMTLEDGQWRIVQMHVSNGQSNMEKIGIEHRVLDDLVDAARQGFRQDQREGMASVMFTDIVNSSALADLLGDRIWVRIVQEHLELTAEIIAGHGGQTVKSLGDGTMSSFPTARAALTAALELRHRIQVSEREPALTVRIGIHSGDVIQTDDDFFGTVVNKAARISATADPDSILVSEATKLLSGRATEFDFEDAGQFTLRGLPGTHRLFALATAP